MDAKAVDVLAVMRRAEDMIYSEFHTAANQDPAADLERAREAVAELIAADKECDDLSAQLRAMDRAGPRHNSYGTGWEIRDRAHRKEVEDRFDAACSRRAAALANVSGAAR